jgi:hypothetical protein
MDVSQKIERYKELFNNDPLYQEINRRGLLDDLFAPCLLFERVHFDSTSNFSTKQAAEILEIPGREQTLINFLNRHEFKSYIDIYRQGSRGYYRYDYKTLFQFKMILMLTDLGLSPADIATMVGTRPEYSDSFGKQNKERFTTLPPQLDIEEKVREEVHGHLKNSFIAFNHQLIKKDKEIFDIKKNVYNDKLETIQEALDKWEKQMTDIVEMISNVDVNISMHEIHLDLMKNPNQKSIFGFKIKEKPEPQIQEKITLFESKLEEFRNYRSKLKARKNELEKEKLQLVSKHQALQEYVQNMEKKHLERMNQQLLEIGDIDSEE